MNAQPDFFDEAQQMLVRQVRRQPYLTVGAAMGVGYILGGGMPNWLVRSVVNVAIRTAASAALRNALTNLDPTEEA